VNVHTTHNNALPIWQQRLPAAERMLLDMEWLESVVCHVVDSSHFGFGVIVHLQFVYVFQVASHKPMRVEVTSNVWRTLNATSHVYTMH